MGTFGLKSHTVQQITHVFKNYPNIEKCLIYGSRAMGNYCPASDMDLTLIGEKLTLTELFKIENELDDLLLPYKIDLSIYHQIQDDGLKAHIDRKGKVFFENVLI